MSSALVALLAAFFAASLRALELWRGNIRVDVINAVVITTFGAGRGRDVAAVLNVGVGAPYRKVAESLTEAATGLSRRAGLGSPDAGEARKRLEETAARALVAANRSLHRNAWLDVVTFSAAVVAGGRGVITGALTGQLALLLLAVSLLWLSNVLTVRTVSTRMAVGAMALAEGLSEALGGASAAVPESQESTVDTDA